MNKDNVVELVYATMPYANQITNLSTEEDDAVRFTWRGDRFRVTLDLSVEEVDGNMLSGSNVSMLLKALLKSNDDDR